MDSKCPGQDPKNVSAKIIKCQHCGYEIEIFSDELKVRCPKCKNINYQEKMPSCIEWCKGAKECVGQSYYDTYLENKSQILKNKILKELEDYFGQDLKRINHAKRVMDFAEELLQREKGDWQIVVPASILHDVGIKAAEGKYASSAGHLQEKEGPAIARSILLRLGVKKADIDEICEIIGHHHTPGIVKTKNFNILYDADWLVNLKDEFDLGAKDKVAKIIDKVFLTESGKTIAKTIYL